MDILRATQAELQRVTSGEGSKESFWEEARQRLEAELESRANELATRTGELETRTSELETRTYELDVANAERARLEESLQAAHAELQRMSAAQAEAAGLQRLAEGDWQDRFAWIKEQAKRTVEGR